jgi:hypothetical protein
MASLMAFVHGDRSVAWWRLRAYFVNTGNQLELENGREKPETSPDNWSPPTL